MKQIKAMLNDKGKLFTIHNWMEWLKFTGFKDWMIPSVAKQLYEYNSSLYEENNNNMDAK
jgi:hypothetical protein